MKIERVRIERRSIELDPPFNAAWDPVPRRSFEATLVSVETDEGLTGIGSGDTMDGFERYEHLFLGEDPLALERHVAVLETMAFHAGRYWPLEAALWDLAGKAMGKPVHSLLGAAYRDRVPVYASALFTEDPGEMTEVGQRYAAQGFAAVKFGWGPMGRSLADFSDPMLIPWQGGVVVTSPDGKPLGGIGVSGRRSDEDEVIAKAGLAAMKLGGR